MPNCDIVQNWDTLVLIMSVKANVIFYIPYTFCFLQNVRTVFVLLIGAHTLLKESLGFRSAHFL